MNNPLFDKEFLKNLYEHREKEVYAKVIALTFDEHSVEEIQGRITQGSINIDGTSSMRRSCSLSLVAHELNINDFYWGLNSKFKLEVGLRNTINSEYPDIIWFKQGIYLITSFSTSQSTNNYTISIQGKDKMALLNGEIGGSLWAQHDFGKEDYIKKVYNLVTLTDTTYVKNKYYTTENEYKKTFLTPWTYEPNTYYELKNDTYELCYDLKFSYTKDYYYKVYNICAEDFDENKEYYELEQIYTTVSIPIKYIIYEIINTYAKEPAGNIIINNLDKYGVELLDYKGSENSPMYMFIGADGEEIGECKQITLNGDQKCWVAGEEPTEANALTLKTIEERGYHYDKRIQLTIDSEEVNNATKFWITKPDEITPNPTEYTIAKITYGETCGYRLTDLVYAGDLIANIGESLTSILDKIVAMLGNFEYFYNTDGQFIFQEKKTYTQNSWSNIINTEITNEDGVYTETYVANPGDEMPATWTFEGGELVSSFNNSPNLANVKNDYALWGTKTTLTGAEVPIHLRYAIDKKPIQYINFNGEVFKTTGDEHVYDWRELIYQMALDYYNHHHEDDFLINLRNKNGLNEIGEWYYPTGYTGYEEYYADMEGFWRQLYNPFSETSNPLNKEYNEAGWCVDIINNPENALFWFDFLETTGELNKYSVTAVGDRVKSTNDNKIKSVYYKETPNVLFSNDIQHMERQDGYTYVQYQDSMSGLFSISTQGKSAINVLDEYLYNYTYCVESITMNAIPIYHLEPNTRIYIHDENSKINGEYAISRITIPLAYNGTMQITATKIVEESATEVTGSGGSTGKKSYLDIAVEGYDDIYDRFAHYAKAICQQSGASISSGLTPSCEINITASTKPGKSYNLLPSISSVGEKTIYYTISKSGYNTETGSVIIKVNTRELMLSDIKLAESHLTYNGKEQQLAITYENNMDRYVMVENFAHTNAGDYELHVSIIDPLSCIWEDDKTTNIKAIPWSIDKLDIADTVCTVENQQYTGSPCEPIPTITVDGVVISSDNFDCVYEDNINATNNAKITITGKNNCTGSRVVTFVIEPRKLPFPRPLAVLIYNNEDQFPDWDNADRRYMSYDENPQKKIGKYTTTFTLIDSNCQWSDGTLDPKDVEWVIAKGSFDPVVTGYSGTYDGNPHYGTINYPISGAVIWCGLTSECTTLVTPDSDFNETYIIPISITNVGSVDVYYKVIHEDTGTSFGKINLSVSKLPIPLPTCSREISYTGEVISPMWDYDIRYVNLISGGSGSAVAEYKALFALIDPINTLWWDGSINTKTVVWEIKPISLGNLKVRDAQWMSSYGYWMLDEQFDYTGFEHTPVPEIYSEEDPDFKLNSNDYIITYSRNINATSGTNYAQIQIIGQGNYNGSIQIRFIINKKVLQIPTPVNNLVFNFTEQLPAWNDYDATYMIKTETSDSHINAGNYNTRFALTNTGNLCWSDNTVNQKNIDWSISPLNVDNLMIQGLESKIYTGNGITQDVSLTYGDFTASTNDYIVSYENNINVGTATIIIDGNNNLSGRIINTFNIRPLDISTIPGLMIEISNSRVGTAIQVGDSLTSSLSSAAVTCSFRWERYNSIYDKSDILSYSNTYTVVSEDCASNIQFRIIAIGTGNYTGNIMYTFSKIKQWTEHDKTKELTVINKTGEESRIYNWYEHYIIGQDLDGQSSDIERVRKINITTSINGNALDDTSFNYTYLRVVAVKTQSLCTDENIEAYEKYRDGIESINTGSLSSENTLDLLSVPRTLVNGVVSIDVDIPYNYDCFYIYLGSNNITIQEDEEYTCCMPSMQVLLTKYSKYE